MLQKLVNLLIIKTRCISIWCLWKNSNFMPSTVSAKRHRTTNTNKNKKQVKTQTVNQLWVYIHMYI